MNKFHQQIKEWALEAAIGPIRNLGGPEREEIILLGLSNGSVIQVHSYLNLV